VLWVSAADGCACCAQTGIAIADASVSTANWRGNKLETLGSIFIDLIPFVAQLLKNHMSGVRCCPLALIQCKAAAKGDTLHDKTHI
jgi:hypothetical protein